MIPSKESGEFELSPSLLEQLGVEACFHEIISELCGGRLDYIHDITADDLMAKTDSNGVRIPTAVARGLVRKLQSHKQSILDKSAQATDQNEDAKRFRESNAISPDSGQCRLSLLRGGEDFATLLRCSVKGTVRQSNNTPERKKVLTAVLDRSASMRNHWPLVVDAVSKVFTNDLLNDSCVSLKAVAYSTSAEEVKLPPTSSELSSLLLRKFSPSGITNFKSAFELAEDLIREEVNRLVHRDGIPASAVDVTTLIFTDGADTSVAPLGYVSEAAAAKAREAGHSFRDSMKSLGCSAYTCVAAFGEHHNPEQCQSLSDRYYYINRREVLSDWLICGLSDLLRSSGSCSLSVQLPSRLELLESIPNAIQLDSEGSFEYEIWLQEQSPGSLAVVDDNITVCIGENGIASASGTVSLSSSHVADTECLQGWLFLLDAGEMQLRQIALELRGRRPSPTKLAMLRERLVGVQALLQPVSDKASDPKARINGRSLILSRVEELEERRNRLSYTLGHFEEEDHGDTRKIGAIGIDAVLRDVSQRVPLGPEATRYARRAERAAAMRFAENLSGYGKEATFDALSNCDAKQAADQGDAMFFCVCDTSFSSDRSNISSASDCLDAPVAHDAFMLLSSKRGRSRSSLQSVDISKAQLGIPVYATAGHFDRAALILPEVLERLSGSYERGKSERLLLDLLGQSFRAFLTDAGRLQISSMALIQKARSVYAVFKSTKSPSGASCLLDDVLSEAKLFVENAEFRKGAKNLYSIAAIGLLAQDLPLSNIKHLGDALIEESMRRAIMHSLAGKSKMEKIQLAWAFLGNSNGNDDWLGFPLENTEGTQGTEGFDILRVGPEMEEIEKSSPNHYCPRNPAIVSDVLCSRLPAGTLRAKEWCALRTFYHQWGSVVDKERADDGLWGLLDKIMVDDDEKCREALARIRMAARLYHEARVLGDVLHDPSAALYLFARECLKGMSYSSSRSSKQTSQVSVRLKLASVAKLLVEERERLARDHPIVGAAYPHFSHMRRPTEKTLHDVWGSQAHPVNRELHAEVRRAVHREKWDRPLTVREALTDRRYRKLGGRFEFPTKLDTFVPGLHRRTSDLRDAWRSKGRQTQGVEAREAAVEEMLLRLPWDDRDDRARRKLTEILKEIWDGLNGVPSGKPLASALWIDDDVEDESEGSDACKGERSDDTNGDGWDVL